MSDKFLLPPYSVLMSVYDKENPDFLRESIESMMSQTLPPPDFVLVCDGKLTPELDDVVKYYEENYECFHPVKLKEKVGTGQCANIGIENCKYEYIVKMDSDDIALPERCERSMYALAKHREIDMLGAFIEEFSSETGEVLSVRKTPVKSDEIKKYARRRNPFNNQTLVYKKSAAHKCGGYSDIKRCEDYDFVVRMLSSGAVGINLPKVLVRYRVTEDNFIRRKNWTNTKAFISVRWKIHKNGFSGFMDFLIPSIMQLGIFIMPKAFTRKIYNKFLRK